MAPAYPQAPPPSFERRRIGNAIAVDGFGSPGSVKEIDCRFEEERRGWEMRVRDLEEEVRSIGCKREENEGCHKDGSRIDPRGDIVINWVEGV